MVEGRGQGSLGKILWDRDLGTAHVPSVSWASTEAVRFVYYVKNASFVLGMDYVPKIRQY